MEDGRKGGREGGREEGISHWRRLWLHSRASPPRPAPPQHCPNTAHAPSSRYLSATTRSCTALSARRAFADDLVRATFVLTASHLSRHLPPQNRDNPQLYGTDREASIRQSDDPFYKRFAAECSRVQITVDVYSFSSQYIDLASLAAMPRYTCGEVRVWG